METDINIFESNASLNCKIKTSEVLMITSYPPRECGIATYSQDLMNSISNKFEGTFEIKICALETNAEKHIYKTNPKFVLNVDLTDAFEKTAKAINIDDSISLVLIQHEFGFFVNRKEDFLLFLKDITKPIIFVFHTVLPKPDNELKFYVRQMVLMASSIIVMTKNAARILIDDYYIPELLITIIPHGTHLITPVNKFELKKQYQLQDQKIISTFGLLSEGKGIEVTLRAMPKIIASHPDIIFLILGKTHPTVKEREGEKYRDSLKKIIAELKISANVKFVNEYLPLDEILSYLQISDVYLFTSMDPNQAVSGTFSYAVSCGCPIISTPIPHALEVLHNDLGVIIDFGNSDQLAFAVNKLLCDEELRKSKSLNGLHIMAPTAWENSAIAHSQLFKRINKSFPILTYKLPPIKLDHVRRMTTKVGIIQFSKIANPDLNSGYTLDDNARALIALCDQYELTKESADLLIINTYLQFIKYCLQPSGSFLNYVDKHKQFTQQNFNENLEDSNGRAIWALGYLISKKSIIPDYFINEANSVLEIAVHHLEKIHSTRAMAFIIKGLHYQNNVNNLLLLKTFANRLLQMYRHEKTEKWHWFEKYLTYGNSLLPEALLLAYTSTKDETYKTVAKESFDFLLSKIFISNRIKVVSNKGWMQNNFKGISKIGGEQPIDVAYTVIALKTFAKVFKDPAYLKKMNIAFNWFLGDNHLNQIIYNPITGGCYDGLEELDVNLNQGAESTVSYLIARLAMEVQNETEIKNMIPYNSSMIKKVALAF
jgi:glycosyltransferase involved in cell wall biosynthesis